MKHSLTRRVVARVATMGTVAALLVGMHGAAGASTLGGTATITLPAQAACTGDTATGGYHVYSYLVQAGTDVTTVTFQPSPSAGYGILDTTGTYYGPANTAINTGQIIGIPNNFQWSQLTAASGFGLSVSDLLYSGTTGSWTTGLVCANSTGHVTDYWTTPVTFTASNSDANGFTWAAVPGVPTGTPEAPLAILLPLVGVAVVGGAIGINRRRRGRLTPASVSSNS